MIMRLKIIGLIVVAVLLLMSCGKSDDAGDNTAAVENAGTEAANIKPETPRQEATEVSEAAVAPSNVPFQAAPVAPAAPEKKPADVEKKKMPVVTFVEIGSVNCIPCRAMQPIMKAVEEEFGEQLKVVFHDVWTPEGKMDAAKYNIRVIPTQVFLNQDGNEYFRHEGYFPQEGVVEILKRGGVK